jgi:hypothetical protein
MNDYLVEDLPDGYNWGYCFHRDDLTESTIYTSIQAFIDPFTSSNVPCYIDAKS